MQVPRMTTGLKESLLLRADVPGFSSKSGGLLSSLGGKGCFWLQLPGPTPRESPQALTWANLAMLLQRRNTPV